MPYTRTTWQDYPNTTTPITATALNNIESQIVTLDRQFGIYANEAARDAAIGSPVEGMMAYLTAPTVPAATGQNTQVPTGVVTIYNGSAWVCTTPVGANSGASSSTTSTAYVTTLTSDTTALSVTLATGTTALVSYGTMCSINTSGTNISSISVSGASTIAASDGIGLWNQTNSITLSLQFQFVFTGLTAGTNTFTMAHRTTAGTSFYLRRHLTVQGIA